VRSKNFRVAAEKQQGGSLPPSLVAELARFSRELPLYRTLTFAATAVALAWGEASLLARAALWALVWPWKSESELQFLPQSQWPSLSLWRLQSALPSLTQLRLPSL
jgi:hypothetical protein